mmetsp:Transcript_6134/g.14787  ORF Transcript_6134/g.14787 Transcript_6134/m.14787 type:complete len:193 (-) Transcript_6134:363-941(-)
MLEDFLAFTSRSAKLVVHFFKEDSILAKRLPLIYGPRSILSYLYRVYAASFAGFLISGRIRLLAVSVGGFAFNAVGVGAVLGVYGGFTKFASIPHLIALGYPAWMVGEELKGLSVARAPLAWASCAASLAFYVPVLLGDLGELYQLFVQHKFYVLMPDGVVHPLKTWTTPDTSVRLDMTDMFVTAIPAQRSE